MESVYLKQLVNITPKGGTSDINAPYSFLEWKERLPSVVEKDAVYHYNEYVLDWFDKNKQKTVSQSFILRQKYLYLLNQLQLFFTEEEKNNWYAQVNLADERELLQSIPYFARKLRDIALYYLKLRKQLKNTKLQYNTTGTTAGVEQQIYSYLIETFSTSNNELSSNLYTTLPSFSALQNSLVVQVEELYDDKQYFDLSPTVPLSSYFNFLDQATGSFLATKGIVLSSSEWLFRSFNIPLSTNFDSFINQLTGNVFEVSDANLYGNFIQKYIAENKYSVSFTSPSAIVEVTDVSIASGNNYFYYPYGTTDASLSIPNQIEIVALSSLNMEFATAGATIETSDTIFVKNGDDIKGAWLRYQEFEETTETVKALLKKDSTTSFIFPFPGYGLSGQDLPWTGPSFETNAEYDFLSRNLKAQVNEAYWSQALSGNSCESILLNNTTLVSSGATPNINPSFADQFFIRSNENESTTIPRGELSGAWLYKFTRTALPISPNQDNVLLWPYNIIDTTKNYPEHLKKISYHQACNPVSIQDFSKSFSIAASSIDLADKIYKLNNFKDKPEAALECAWLSGSTTNLSGYHFVEQDGFAALFPAGETTRFVWTGAEANLNFVFRSANHRIDCPFVTNVPAVSAFEWQKCTCKQVYHSPFGHPDKSFQVENSFADLIAEDTENKLTPFDLGSWRDSTDNPSFSSLEFAWYKTNSKHGWGDGQWVSSIALSAQPFTLKPGKAYFYRRSQTRTSSESMPSYVVNFDFNTNTTKWVEAKLTSDGSWASTGKDSLMSLYPGDLVKYDRQKQTTSYLLSSVVVENVSTNKNSIWSTYDTIAIDSIQNTTTVAWPVATKPFGSTDNQYPTTSFLDITAVNAWKITRIEDNQSQTIANLSIVTFIPPTTGTYTIAVTATKAGGQKVYESSIIPAITAIPQYSNEEIKLEFETPSSGFLIEHPLNGWNYNTNSIDSRAAGARPYWVTLDSQKDSTTRYKGIYSWGYPDSYVDGYLPNSNPIISPLEITYGTILEYFHKGYVFNWTQPINFKNFVGKTQWCTLSSVTTQFSNLSAFYKSKQGPELNVIVKDTPSDILLSNVINGAPVEIFYYALSSFVWPVSVNVIQDTVIPTPSALFVAQSPWTTLTNRFYPTIANVPVVDETYSLEDVGGYFLPQHLGGSQFINKNFDVNLKTTNLSGTFLAEDTNIHVGGRGRTKQDQNTIYEWTENNQWLKESSTTGELAGAVRQNLTKTLQTFIPYQSNIEETALGLVTPRSRISPWGGLNDEEWTDVANEPKSFTGVRNVSAWVETQILKESEQVTDCWSSDIYGNQYGLFKQLTAVPVVDRINTSGELWTRTNSQSVLPAYISLSAIFKPFENINITVYKELTGSGIRYIECYFDTIFIETESAVIFAKIDYDYNTALIESTFDDTRYKILSSTGSFDRNWFFSTEKRIVSLYTETDNNVFSPALYELDLPTRKYKKVFPLGSTNTSSLTAGLSSLNFTDVSRGSLYYNSSLKTYLITYTGTDSNNKMFVADFYVTKEDQLNLTKINLYRDLFDATIINEPPSSVYPSLTCVPNTFSVFVSANNSPTTFTLLNYLSSVTVSNAGVFSGTLPAGLHHINYAVGNLIGECIYSLSLCISGSFEDNPIEPVEPVTGCQCANIYQHYDTPGGEHVFGIVLRNCGQTNLDVVGGQSCITAVDCFLNEYDEEECFEYEECSFDPFYFSSIAVSGINSGVAIDTIQANKVGEPYYGAAYTVAQLTPGSTTTGAFRLTALPPIDLDGFHRWSITIPYFNQPSCIVNVMLSSNFVQVPYVPL